LALAGSAHAQPVQRLSTTQTGGTIAVTNTYQQVLASSARNGCLIYNNGTHQMLVYFGLLANATLTNGFPVAAQNWISCSVGGVGALSDAVSITGTSGDAFVVGVQ
jgi:hypothetical protein